MSKERGAKVGLKLISQGRRSRFNPVLDDSRRRSLTWPQLIDLDIMAPLRRIQRSQGPHRTCADNDDLLLRRHCRRTGVVTRDRPAAAGHEQGTNRALRNAASRHCPVVLVLLLCLRWRDLRIWPEAVVLQSRRFPVPPHFSGGSNRIAASRHPRRRPTLLLRYLCLG